LSQTITKVLLGYHTAYRLLPGSPRTYVKFESVFPKQQITIIKSIIIHNNKLVTKDAVIVRPFSQPYFFPAKKDIFVKSANEVFTGN